MSCCYSSERGGLSPAFFRPGPVARGPVPRATVKKRADYRRARACPSPCHRNGNGFGWRAFFARVERSRGTGPRATGGKAVSVSRRARACPSPCLDRGNGFGWRAFFARVERSRGTGPRATGTEGVLFAMRRSGSGDPELQSPAHLLLILEIL